MSLLETTLILARNAQEPVKQICDAAGVTTRWYYMLLDGEIHDPGVRRIQRLHDYLAERSGEKQEEPTNEHRGAA